jgi:FtsP/CotA-like multicopper oxidase with cupredoxin domain
LSLSVRDVLLINGRFLRNATVTLHRGDVLDITLINGLPPSFPDVEAGLTLHFHGLAMAGGAAWYDGVPFLHQCPVAPGGGRMAYRFRVDEGPGTFWVHAHNMQIMDGLFAPLIILPPRGAADPALEGTGLAQPALDIPLMIGDWYHTSATGLAVGLQRPFDAAKVVKGSGGGGGGHGGGGHGGGGHGGNATGEEATGAWEWVQQPQAVLFNGRGFFGDCLVGAAGNKTEPVCGVASLTVPPGRSAANPAGSTSNPGCTHEVVAVPAGRTTRLRLIGTGSLAYLTVCVEGHSLTLIAADGVPVSPFTTTCVDLNLGQRLDVLLTADKGRAGDVFWISALPQFRPGSPAGYAGEEYRAKLRELESACGRAAAEGTRWEREGAAGRRHRRRAKKRAERLAHTNSKKKKKKPFQSFNTRTARTPSTPPPACPPRPHPSPAV